MGNEVDHIQTGHILAFQEVNRLRLLFGKDSDQNVGTADLPFARALNVEDGALKHALEAQRWLGIAAIILIPQQWGG